jgi:hypothetical protein
MQKIIFLNISKFRNIDKPKSFDEALRTCNRLENKRRVEKDDHECDISGMMTINQLRDFMDHTHSHDGSKVPDQKLKERIRLNAFYHDGSWHTKCK